MNCMTGAAAWGFRELPLEEQLKICRKLGCGCLELGLANAPGDISLDADEQEIRKIRELYEKYDIRLLCAATGNDFTLADMGEIPGQVEKVKRSVDICRRAGILYLRIFAGFTHVTEVRGERWKQMICAMNEAASYAKEQGVVLAVETHGGVNCFEDGVEHFPSVTTETETLERMLKELDETVQFVFDPANLAAAGHEKVRGKYEILKKRIAYMHVKNFIRLPSGHLDPAAAETGIFDWKEFLSEIAPVSEMLLIEYEKPETLELGTGESMKSMRKWGI